MFAAFKHLHMTMAVLTVLFLILRFAYGMRGAANLNKKWLKALPHVVDFLLVVSIAGMLISLSMSPFAASWVTEKLVVFILYIVFSVVMVLSLRGRMSRSLRVPAFVLALASWLWLIHVAMSKSAVLL
ncbi:invasion protein [Aliidiomarina sedimenti]|uniref:Invasion protein n=1 Tax=Aliidiomarina sedimenti TaxID=1933879 RepID=A0ABY0C358_9GAMM|nr:SirB2 family protein [Aliidiomarina sedimenti]RUO32119.1 invasion protein [Aliidiomarina sedimenti]